MQKVIETITYVIFDNVRKEYYARTDNGLSEFFTPDIELAKKFTDVPDTKYIIEELIDDYWWAQKADVQTFLVKKCIVTKKYDVIDD